MTLSIWRYSHFVLAALSSLFLMIASTTGVILAVEPIQHELKGYQTRPLESVSLATVISAVQQQYDQVFALEIDPAGFVTASVLTEDFETIDMYIDPLDGTAIAPVEERAAIYSFATNLHRSLFLKTTGRIFVGVFSFLLLVIAFTGFLLLLKRQGGLKMLFSRVHKDYAAMRYHVILSRLFLIPIIIVAGTGVYLSLEKLQLLPESKSIVQEQTPTASRPLYSSIEEIPFYRETTLDQVKQVEFPFSNAADDFFIIALHDQELQVNQQTGAIVRSTLYPWQQFIAQISLQLHTGIGNSWWSLVLLLASLSILYFIYSGAIMSYKRLKNRQSYSNNWDKGECQTIVLMGSETGSTYVFAQRFCNALKKTGVTVYLDSLNNYQEFKSMKQLIVFTATYGNGEAPNNAQKFKQLVYNHNTELNFSYAVVGFGSREYPDYCKFAIQVDGLLARQQNAMPQLPLHLVNNSNEQEFQEFVSRYASATGLALEVTAPSPKNSSTPIALQVVHKTRLNEDDTFLIRYKVITKTRFESGDLLEIVPPAADRARLYSVARIKDHIVLSVKKHEQGVASNFLLESPLGSVIESQVKINKHFHYPKKAPHIIFIANGTGIAPFLGMLAASKNVKTDVFWGLRSAASLALYDNYLDLFDPSYIQLHTAFSRVATPQYVQSLVRLQGDMIAQSLLQGGVIMICGALAMQQDVLAVIEDLFHDNPQINVDVLIQRRQLLMDCY